MQTSVKTTCPYCGVGCGIVANIADKGQVTVTGDQQHPANYGRLCSKGAALAETLSLDGRLLYPLIHGEQVDWDTALNTVSSRFTNCIQQFGPDSVAFYVSGQLLTEDYYVANKLMKGFIGSANIDTNSRLCMSSSVAGHKRAFGSDTVPCSYEDLERAKLIVLVGSNTAWCHPVLFQRIKKAKKAAADVKVVVIDPRHTATCEIADLHLPLQPGTDSILFNGLLAYLWEQDEHNRLFTDTCTQGMDEALEAAKASSPSMSATAQACGLTERAVTEFYSWFAQTERVVSVYSQGVNQSSSGTDKVNAIINCHLLTGRIGRPGMGPFSFTGQPNAMGGREVGGLANQLACHMEIENAGHRSLVQDFWKSPRMADKAGLKAVELFDAVNEGKVKAIWIMGTNPAVSMPEANLVRSALERCEFVVVSDCMRHTDTTQYADALLPALTWGEKDGMVTNSERRLSRQKRFLPPPGEAKSDWWIICEVAKKMGFAAAFSYTGPLEIFREYARLSGYRNNGSRDFDIAALHELDQATYDDFEPLQWPVKTTDSDQWQGEKRLFADGKFYTLSKKAQFIPIQPRQPAHPATKDYPFVLNTGRVRDQWHTMTRTAKAARLSEHSPEPYAELHSSDAKLLGIVEHQLVKIISSHAEVIVRAKVADEQRPGSVFVPMHWNQQFASNANVDSIVNAALDPISGQPEFKHTPVKIEPYNPNWYGFLLTRRELRPLDADYWVKSQGEGYYRYELAGEQSPADWPVWVRSYLCASHADVNWVEYLDVAVKQYRGVRLLGDTVESCIFIAPNHALPPRNWLASLFKKAKLSESERISLLTGEPPAGQKEQGKTVCACFGVGEKTILETIASNNITNVEQIGSVLQAGTNCGSCIPELKELLQRR
ncbi:MAG: molybdopterin-dependent oxidoreductase [Gammaproteobacteria bacterium]|nr:molybdopterin-dependent oxidoreductase [Gammaproteobacteria bacterium]